LAGNGSPETTWGICPLLSKTHVAEAPLSLSKGNLAVAPVTVPCVGPRCALFVSYECDDCDETHEGCAIAAIGFGLSHSMPKK